MTSASELFHNRRSRFGVRSSTVVDPGFDSSPTDATSSSFSHHHRTTATNRRHLHHYPNNSRRDRHDLDGCDPPLRRIHRHRLGVSSQEQESVLHEQDGGRSSSGSIINSDDFRSIRSGRRATGNDRLPGAVLLARERLLERLRGVSVSGNRQHRRASSSIRQDDFSNSGSSTFVESDNYFFEISGDWLEEIASESWRPSMPMSASEESRRKRPSGLAQDVINCLPLEVFSSVEKNEESETSSASWECTICLESFHDGDELIGLPCMHRFHSCCLFPWVQVCGACPNCRKAIVLTPDKPVP